jgi:lipopolysaccharide transport system ATP-binding protein
VSTTLLAMQIGFDQELTGRANALVSGMLLGFSKKEVLANMEKVIDFAELHDFIDRPTRTYSAGMKARLGFSIALEMSPDVLLIDEVLGVGDAKFKKKSMAVMKEKLLSDQTIVFVSHSAAMVKSLCNKAIWIENGITVMQGDSDAVVDAYTNALNNHG